MAIVPDPVSICNLFVDNMDNYNSTIIRQTQYYIGLDNTEETMTLYPTLQRSPFISPVHTQSQFTDILLTLDCVAKVQYINPYTTIIWVNVQTPTDFDTRPFTIRTGIFGSSYFHYPVPISIADEIVGSVVFNLHLKIVTIERAMFSFAHFGKTYVPYIINFSP